MCFESGGVSSSFDELPATWVLRSISTAIPLATALARVDHFQESVGVARRTLPLITRVRARTLEHQFVRYLHQDLLEAAPHNIHCQEFVAEAQQRLAPSEASGLR